MALVVLKDHGVLHRPRALAFLCGARAQAAAPPPTAAAAPAAAPLSPAEDREIPPVPERTLSPVHLYARPEPGPFLPEDRTLPFSMDDAI